MSQVLPKPKPLPDPLDIVIQGCRENNLQYQEQLYKHCYPDMIKICWRYAGDKDNAGVIYNNAMLRVFKNMNAYRHEGKMMGWVKVIVVNCCLDFIKKKNKFINEPISEEIEALPGNGFEILDTVSTKDIRRIIFELPKATATVFNLYVYEGFTHKQIAESLGISEGTSKWHVNEARKRLSISLKEFLTP